MRHKYIQGIYGEIAGKLEQKMMDLENLLSNMSGIGEHGDLSTEIKKQLAEVDRLRSLKDTMEELFSRGRTFEGQEESGQVQPENVPPVDPAQFEG